MAIEILILLVTVSVPVILIGLAITAVLLIFRARFRGPKR